LHANNIQPRLVKKAYTYPETLYPGQLIQ
jgi:hypothetical protein